MFNILGFYKKIKIQNKLLLFILTFTILIYIVAFSLVISGMRNKIFSDAEKLIQSNAREYANLVGEELNFDFDITQGMGWSMHGFKNVPQELFFYFYKDILKNNIERNPNFYSTWISWELSEIDPDYYLPYGRIRQTYFKHGNQIRYKQDTLNLGGDVIGGLYHQVKVAMKDYMSDPYWYSYTGRTEDQVLEVSPCIPIIINGKFAGLAGSDIVLSRFQDLSQSIKPFDVGYTFIISNNGTYVGHPNESFVGQKISDIRPEYSRENSIVEKISRGEFFSHVSHDNYFNGDAYIAYAPVYIGNTQIPWSVGSAVPMSIIVSEANRILLRSIIVAIIGLALLSYLIYIVARRISKPLSTISRVLEKIAIGDLRDTRKIKVKTEDEIGTISKALNSLIDGLNKTADFANEIGRGNLEAEFNMLGDNDVLGEALLNMRESLKHANIEEVKRQEEDNRRNWATQGHAMFAEILRQNNDDINTLSFNVIKNLVKYLSANQGGIFILNDDDEKNKFLEMKACYAFDRQKYLTKKIEIGEGLVGACFLEKKTVYLAKVPEDYILITSGLGDEVPSTVLIVPLIVNDNIFGVVELAAFKPFDAHFIDFVEKIGESIASTISSVKINVRTKFLLEQSQQQAEEMSAQEEEMRQNMEEMHATQEEMARKELTLQNVIKTTNTFQIFVEYDFNGIIKNSNDLLSNLLGYTKDELRGKHHSILFADEDYKGSDEYGDFWVKMNDQENLLQEFRLLAKNGDILTFTGVYHPVFDQGYPLKVMQFGVNVTDYLCK
ncbi:MAG: GAF domain-containing protein [Bacteroidetes bacterium]|nr:GAF domain-containing protein [Bacteroidota bacterium]